jgi:predicted Zn-dependent peptidase
MPTMKTRYLFFSLTLVTSILVAVPARAQEAPPAGGEPRDFVVPSGTSFQLSNGLRATLTPYGVLPKVSVLASIRVGNINESDDEVWLADLTGSLMQEGTAEKDAKAVAREAADMGGSLNIGTGLDQSTVGGNVLSEFGPDLVRLIAEVVRNPAFPDSELSRLKRDMVRNISISQSQPGTKALVKFREVLHGDHPYGRIFPDAEMVEGFTTEAVRAFYEANYGAARTHIYVAGMFDVGEMEQAIREYFGDWTEGPQPLIDIPTTSTQRAVHIVDVPGAVQSNVYIGLPVIDPSHEDFIALTVTNSLLGGSFASRITSNIREDKGYTYSPFSTLSGRYRDAYWAEVAAITTEVTGAALREIFLEIDRLQAEPPSAEELEGIQNYLAGTFVLQNSSPGGIIGQLIHLDLHGLPDDYLNTYVQKVYAVTPAEVQRVASEYLRDEDMVIVIAGDRAAIEAQVAGLGRLAP